MQQLIPFGKITVLLLIVCSIPGRLYAQIDQDSMYMTPEVEVVSYRYDDFHTGSKSLVIDSVYLRNNPGNLSDVLANQSSVYIKNYGPSGIASISMRGGSASQTQTTMNGMIINSPTLGQSDFSTIPSFLFNTLSIQYGPQVTLMGSGAIGGSIHLSNTPVFVTRKQIGISYQQASFGSHLPIVFLQIGNTKHQLTVKAYAKDADNTIRYYRNGEKDTLSHAHQKQAGTYVDYAFSIKKHSVQAWMWYQKMNTDVPGTLSAPVSYATQYERNLKTGLQWKYQLRRSSVQTRLGIQNDKMNYNIGNPSVPLITNTQVLQAEAEYRYAVTSHIDVMAGTQALLQRAQSDNFNKGTHQNKIGVFLTSKIRLFKNRLELAPSVRKEWCNQQTIPLTPSVGAEYHIHKLLKLHGLASYSYRIPTLNDLYYNPGGNPTLKPEYGWSYEGGIAFEKKTSSIRLFQDLTVYSKTISDWIIWLPPETGVNWTPENIQNVWSRGLESESAVSFFIQKQTVSFRNSFAYTKSTNESGEADKNGKQLIYVPLYKDSFTTSFTGKTAGAGVIYNYTSWSFTTSDNSDYTNPYHLFDVYGTVQKTFKDHYIISVNARINNIMDTNYQVVSNRPMPLRNYQITITLTYN